MPFKNVKGALINAPYKIGDRTEVGELNELETDNDRIKDSAAIVRCAVHLRLVGNL